MSSNGRRSHASRTPLNLEQRIAHIRKLNDAFRATGIGGRTMITSGVSALGNDVASAIVAKVRAFDAFTADNDPYHEHDMGGVQYESHRLFWKIDYYDKSLTAGSPDPSDPSVTVRVLTIMLVSEY